MSAPTAVDAAAVAVGLAWHVDPPSLGHRVVPPLPTPDRRDLMSSTAQLSRTYDELCTQAVDSWEIAAGLEAVGINDRIARLVYGSASVFDLADTLYAMVPRRPVDMGAPADKWHRPLRRHLLRGLLYGLPGLLLVEAVRRLAAREALLLAVSLLTAGFTQGLAHLGHVLLGREARSQAGDLLCRTVVTVVAVSTLAGTVAWLAGAAGPATAVLVGAVPVYVTSATIVLLVDRHDLLLRLLLPGAVASCADLLLPQGPGGAVAAGAALLGVVGCTLTAWSLAADLRATDAGPALGLTGADLLGALPLLAHGLGSMTLLSLVPLSAVREGSALGPVVPAVLALGHAELQLLRIRARADTLLSRHHVRAFAAAARVDLLERAGLHLVVLSGLSVLVLLLDRGQPGGAGPATGRDLLTYALLALGLFAASAGEPGAGRASRRTRGRGARRGRLALGTAGFAAGLLGCAHLAAAGLFAVASLALSVHWAGRLVGHR